MIMINDGTATWFQWLQQEEPGIKLLLMGSWTHVLPIDLQLPQSNTPITPIFFLQFPGHVKHIQLG